MKRTDTAEPVSAERSLLVTWRPGWSPVTPSTRTKRRECGTVYAAMRGSDAEIKATTIARLFDPCIAATGGGAVADNEADR